MRVNRKDTIGMIAILLFIVDFIIGIISYIINNIGNAEVNIGVSIIISGISVIIPIVLIILRYKNKNLFIICNVLLTCELIAVIVIPLTYLLNVPSFISNYSYLQAFIDVVVKGWGNDILVIIGLVLVIIDAVKHLKKDNYKKEQI